MAKLILKNTDEEIELQDGEAIASYCEEAGVPFACTEGICGTCVIQVIEGQDNLSAPTQEEVDFLGEDSFDERLACQCKLMKGNATIEY